MTSKRVQPITQELIDIVSALVNRIEFENKETDEIHRIIKQIQTDGDGTEGLVSALKFALLALRMNRQKLFEKRSRARSDAALNRVNAELDRDAQVLKSATNALRDVGAIK